MHINVCEFITTLVSLLSMQTSFYKRNKYHNNKQFTSTMFAAVDQIHFKSKL